MNLKITTLLLAIVMFTSCSSDEKTVDFVNNNIQFGALLITTEKGSENFIYNDLNSQYSIEVRENDERKGEFFDFVRVYISFKSKTTNGVNDKEEVVLYDIPRADFYLGEFDRPRTRIEFSFQEALTPFNLEQSEVSPGDQFYIRPEIHLKDGRTIGYANRSPSIIADSCSRSPFYYLVNVISPEPDALFTGFYSYERIFPAGQVVDANDIETGFTNIRSGLFPNQRLSSVINFTIAGDLVHPYIYQEKGGLCRVGSNIVFWGPQEDKFGLLDLSDDSVFDIDFEKAYDGWGGRGDGERSDPMPVKYRFTKQ